MYYVPGGTIWASRREDNSGSALSLSLAFGVEMVVAIPWLSYSYSNTLENFPPCRVKHGCLKGRLGVKRALRPSE